MSCNFRMLMLNIPLIIVLFSLSWIVGMGIYSVYSDCDPLKSGYTKSADAILPFYIEDKYSFVPGLMGIFLSTLFNSALILNVSNLNSLATVTWEDFLSNLPQFKGLEDKKQLQIIKFIGSIYGLMIMGVGFLVQLLSGVIESAQLMTSATSGPLLGEEMKIYPTQMILIVIWLSGVFLLAILVPFANWKGASVGMIVSHIIILAVTFGHLTIDKTVEFLETSVEGCTNDSFSSGIVKPTSPMFISLAQHKPIEVTSWLQRQDALTTTPAPPMVDNSQFPQNIFSISYMYYSLFGTLITVVVGIVVSICTYSDADSYDSKYIHPMIYRLTKWFPKSEKLFSNEQKESTDIKNSSLKEPIEQHFNPAFDIKSEDIMSSNQAFEGDDVNSIKFKANLIYKSDLCAAEKYKKLSEDSILPWKFDCTRNLHRVDKHLNGFAEVSVH